MYKLIDMVQNCKQVRHAAGVCGSPLELVSRGCKLHAHSLNSSICLGPDPNGMPPQLPLHVPLALPAG